MVVIAPLYIPSQAEIEKIKKENKASKKGNHLSGPNLIKYTKKARKEEGKSSV